MTTITDEIEAEIKAHAKLKRFCIAHEYWTLCSHHESFIQGLRKTLEIIERNQSEENNVSESS